MTDMRLCEQCGRRPSMSIAIDRSHPAGGVFCDGSIHDLADAAPELLELLREWRANNWVSPAWAERVGQILARFPEAPHA